MILRELAAGLRGCLPDTKVMLEPFRGQGELELKGLRALSGRNSIQIYLMSGARAGLYAARTLNVGPLLERIERELYDMKWALVRFDLELARGLEMEVVAMPGYMLVRSCAPALWKQRFVVGTL